MDILATFKTEWPLISQAPWSIAAIAIVIYLGLRLYYKGRISDLNELISIRDKQIEDYKAKTGASSPDQAAKRIEKLEQGLGKIQAEWEELADTDFANMYESDDISSFVKALDNAIEGNSELKSRVDELENQPSIDIGKLPTAP